MSPPIAPAPAPQRWFVRLLVAFSGFCSLVYQVVWDRTTRYNFGGDNVSSSIVTATFLLGLGIGALVFGRWHRRAFAVYALVELAIGLYAMQSFFVLAPLATLLGRAFHVTIADVEGLRYSVVAGAILFLLPPCILLGGTLPLMFNCFIGPGRYESRTVGWIYAFNTAGAALGAVGAPLFLLNRLSIPATLALVGTGNVLIAAGIWHYGRRVGTRPASAPEPAETMPFGTILPLAFVSGFVTLAFEVSLFRNFAVVHPSSPYNFPLVLTPFLLSIALGSALFTRLADATAARSLARVGHLFLLGAVGMIVGIALAASLAERPLFHTVSLPTIAYLVALTVPLPLFQSAVFPLLLRLSSSAGETLPRGTGIVYLVNAVGAFTGAMFVQFIGFPALGTRGVVLLLFLLAMAAAAWTLGTASRRGGALLAAALLVAVPVFGARRVWVLYTFGPSATLGVPGLGGVKTPGRVHVVEGETGVATLLWNEGETLADVVINGQYMSELPDHPLHVRLISFPLALPRRGRILLLGLGGGGMVRELLDDPEVVHVEVVDWSRELPRLLDDPRARTLLADALHDPRVVIHRADARVAVGLYPDHDFDVVIDNLTFPEWVGATSVKSIAYYGQVHRITRPDGVFVTSNLATARKAILAGLTQTFRHVLEHHTEVVLCSDEPITIAPARAEAVLTPRAAVLGLKPPYAHWMLGLLAPVAAGDLAGAAPIRDDLLTHEYRVDPIQLLLRSFAGPPSPARRR